ncbi:MAG: ABC transporter ATP-binding protein [Clostridia bacterium]|nr:ABC transporter ATP-binding protein [Clostridia bacterium]
MSEAVETKDIALFVKDITKKCEENIYGKASLSGISFSFEKKGIHGILAPKNSGKTQLMNIIAGCDGCDSGEIEIFGISAKDNIDAKKRIGYVQKYNVFYPNMTALETMNFVGETRRVESGKLYRQIKEAMELVGIDGIKNKLVKNMTDHDVKKLSLAAALLGNPDILLLDEIVIPRMSGDRKSELMGLIQMLGRMKTVVLTTDDYKLARELCDDIVIISDGCVLAKGSFESLDEKLSRSETPMSLEALYNSLASASAAN